MPAGLGVASDRPKLGAAKRQTLTAQMEESRAKLEVRLVLMRFFFCSFFRQPTAFCVDPLRLVELGRRLRLRQELLDLFLCPFGASWSRQPWPGRLFLPR